MRLLEACAYTFPCDYLDLQCVGRNMVESPNPQVSDRFVAMRLGEVDQREHYLETEWSTRPSERPPKVAQNSRFFEIRVRSSFLRSRVQILPVQP